MSLQVWLPLTKDLRNQGLADVTVTNSGATYSSTGGKLGGVYIFDGSDDYIQLNGNDLYSIIKGGSTPFSIAMWVYQADSTRAILFGDYGLTGTIQFNIELTTSHTVRFYWAASPDYTATQTSVGTATWTHITITYDGSKVLFYTNGVLTNTYTGTLASKTKSSGNYYLGRDSRTGTTVLNGKLNDFRIYDHCLSPMEVKSISQGLVLHYPLNRNGWGQENLLLNTHDLTPNSSTTTKNCSQRGSATRQLRNDGFYEAKCTSAWQGISTWANAQNLIVGQKYTYSFYFYTDGSTKSLSFYPMMYNSGGTRDTSSTLPISVDGSTYQNANARAFGSFSNSIPVKHYVTFEWNSTMASIISNGGTIELSIQVHGTFNSGKYGCVYAPKLEIGEKVTPWCPNSSDILATTMGLNGTAEYDCSGCCNNGTRTGTFNWTSDTPKYSVSTKFNGSNYILTDSGTFSWFDFNQLTLAGWMKPTNNPSSYSGSFGIAHNSIDGYYSKCFSISNSSSKFTINAAKGSTWVWIIAPYTVPVNEWHHYVVTLNGTEIKMYVDGELIHSAAIDWGTGTVASDTRFQVGVDLPGSDETYQGYYSDIRAYATALSASDVQSLYQNSAYIDNNGNVYGAVHSEV